MRASVQPTWTGWVSSWARAKSGPNSSRRKAAVTAGSELARFSSRLLRRLKALKLAEPQQAQPSTNKALTWDMPG